MSLSAVSLLLVLGANGQLNTDDEAIVNRIRPMVVTLYSHGSPTGLASAFGPQGRFVAHRTVAQGNDLTIKFQSGHFSKVKITSSDDLTGLVLLEYDEQATPTSRGVAGGGAGGGAGAGAISKSGGARGGAGSAESDLNTAVRDEAPIKVGQRSFKGQTLYVFSLSGVNRAELTNNERFGVNSSSRRALTFSEIRFESQPGPIGGALAFNSDGHLIGILGAALESGDNTNNRIQTVIPKVQQLANNQSNYGPGSMTVAYSVTPDIIQRVLDGFATDSRKVEHPALGILVQDGGDGAKVVSVTKGSNADKAGLHAGDIITEINGVKIGSQFDYTKYLIHRKVGETIQVTLTRDKDVKTVPVQVGT